MIRCNNCYKLFESDEDLEMFCDFEDTERPEFFKGCPDCKTDQHLMDLDDYEGEIKSDKTKGK